MTTKKKRWLLVLAAFSASIPTSFAAEPTPASAILQELRSLREMGSVLYVAAHPDDENTQLITYLARGRRYRTAYLSVTRGDGGQNLLGGEFREQLGIARTQELLAARRLDGGRQFFTRAVDFGYSKDAAETLRIWDRQQVLADVVRVIRQFRPDVVITRFSPIPGGTHGHHTASAILALEAFKLAGDPQAFPEQLDTLTPWQPKRILQNSRGADGTINITVDGDDPVLGLSFADIAARSRAMHKTQGFGNAATRAATGTRTESFQLLDGEAATNDIMDGVDTTWARVPGRGGIGALIDDVIAKFDPQHPDHSVRALLVIKRQLDDSQRQSNEPLLNAKLLQLQRIIQECLGLYVETTVPSASVVPGETLILKHTVVMRAGDVPVRWASTAYAGTYRGILPDLALVPNQAQSQVDSMPLPPDTPLSQPYWLRADGTVGMFEVDDPRLIGRPENPPAFPIFHAFRVYDDSISVEDEPVEITSRADGTKTRQPLAVVAPVSLGFAYNVGLFAPGATRQVFVDVLAHRANAAGTVTLQTPAGWLISPAEQKFQLAAADEVASLAFDITAPANAATATVTARANVNGRQYDNQRQEIRYDHIPLQILQPPARLQAVALDLRTRGQTIAYVPGAGDSVATSLRKMGYTVTEVTGSELTAERLRDFGTVVIGVRAFNTRDDLEASLPALFAWVEAGGTVVVQYNTPNRQNPKMPAPYPLQLSGDRVTDETAAITLLAPDHPVLNTPNKITDADFAGWVQERGLYFPNQWDEHFTPILACHDAGEAPMNGSLLVARHGKGYYVYTGLAFFRQLPAGVPGAYRLLANLVSLGK